MNKISDKVSLDEVDGKSAAPRGSAPTSSGPRSSAPRSRSSSRPRTDQSFRQSAPGFQPVVRSGYVEDDGNQGRSNPLLVGVVIVVCAVLSGGGVYLYDHHKYSVPVAATSTVSPPSNGSPSPRGAQPANAGDLTQDINRLDTSSTTPAQSPTKPQGATAAGNALGVKASNAPPHLKDQEQKLSAQLAAAQSRLAALEAQPPVPTAPDPAKLAALEQKIQAQQEVVNKAQAAHSAPTPVAVPSGSSNEAQQAIAAAQKRVNQCEAAVQTDRHAMDQFKAGNLQSDPLQAQGYNAARSKKRDDYGRLAAAQHTLRLALAQAKGASAGAAHPASNGALRQAQAKLRSLIRQKAALVAGQRNKAAAAADEKRGATAQIARLQTQLAEVRKQE